MRFRQFHLFFIVLSISIVACQKVNIQYGTQALDNQYTQVTVTDTFTTYLSTVKVDSFVTSATGVTLLGGYTDTSFGRIDTKCFFNLKPPPYTSSTVYDSTIYDSLRLILRLNRNYYGDTTKPLHIDVSRLSQQINFPINLYSFYNVDSFPVYNGFIGGGDFIVNPTFYTDTISIPMSDALGQEFLSKLQNGLDLDLQSTNNFLYYFNGLRLSSNATTNLILNCKDSAILRLSYSKVGPDTLENHHIDFTLNSKSHHFNNITVDRSKLVNGLQNLSHNDSIIPSGQMNNRAYSQYASGVMTKITFPSLPNILKIPYFSEILSARLKVIPIMGTWDTYYFLPPSLSLATTNVSNNVGSGLTSAGSNSAETGNLVLDYTNVYNTGYTYDVSSYIKSLAISAQAYSNSITQPPYENYGLLLLPPSPASVTQFSRIVVGNQNQPQNFRTYLEISYLTIQPQ
jgi:hypothetical protein